MISRFSLSNSVRATALLCIFAACAATAKSPAPGALRVVWLGADDAPSSVRLRELRHTLGKQAAVRSISATLGLAAAPDNPSVWSAVKAFDPHVVILAFAPPPASETGRSQLSGRGDEPDRAALRTGSHRVHSKRTRRSRLQRRRPQVRHQRLRQEYQARRFRIRC